MEPNSLPKDAAAATLELRATIGLVLIVVGALVILWGVFHVLGSVPRPEQLDFAHRTTDFQARSAVHASFFPGLARALVGLAFAIGGGVMRGRALRRLGRSE